MKTVHVCNENTLNMINPCRGKFVAPGKFFPPLYSHNVTNPNPNPNPNPSHNPNSDFNLTLNPDPDHNFNLIPKTPTRTAACKNYFPARRIFHYTDTLHWHSQVQFQFFLLSFLLRILCLQKIITINKYFVYCFRLLLIFFRHLVCEYE